ncbi:MAG: DUF4126 family protein [Anaerolineales bacterium]
MAETDGNHYAQIAALGLIAGARSMLVPAVLSDHFSRHQPEPPLAGPLALMTSPLASTLFKFFAVGEFMVDKIPGIPARTEAPGVLGRVGAGVLAGFALSSAHNKNRVVGAVVGGLTALVSTHVSYNLRLFLTKTLPLPDFAVAFAEDALVINGARRVLGG